MAKTRRTARKNEPHRKPAPSKPRRMTVIEGETAPDPQNANVQQSEVEAAEETEQNDNRQDAERAELEQDKDIPPNHER